MCGIAGIVNFSEQPIDRDSLGAMTDALTHRGPDDRGIWLEGNVGLGHRRLSILDLTAASHQPMISEDGRYVVVFNGEIYNFQEERKKLQVLGISFHSRGDTEVLLQLYATYGEECLSHLRGMFAFAIFDRQKRTLFLARDRIGKKPLHYFITGTTFAFASEQKALRKLSTCPSEIDWEALHHFLTLTYLPSPLTGVHGLISLPASHCITINIDTGALVSRRYWALTYSPNMHNSLEEWKDTILSALTESTRIRMIADVPVGAFLSGGVDSATIVALMSQLHTQPVQTFSIGSREPTSELPDAERISRYFGTKHHAFILEPDIVHLLPTLVRTYEEPFGDPSCIPTYLISQFTRDHVTVALSGDGGDECFGGYLRYPILRFSEQWNTLPWPIKESIRQGMHLFHFLRRNTLSYRSMLFHDSLQLPWQQRVLQYMGGFTEDEKSSIYSGKYTSNQRTDTWFNAQTLGARSRADGIIHQAMNTDLETYLPDDLMPKVDLGSMAHGLEVRSPLLDHRLLELTSTLPSNLQIHGRKTKWIFKEILRDILPKETLRKRKQGFRLPLDKWFRGPLRPFVQDRLLTGHPLLWEMFDRARLENFVKEYVESQIDYSSQIWMLLWLREWFEQRDMNC